VKSVRYYFFVFIILLVSSCVEPDQNKKQCPEGYHLVGDSCCLDITSHSVSDWDFTAFGDTTGLTWGIINEISILDDDSILGVGEISLSGDKFNAIKGKGMDWRYIAKRFEFNPGLFAVPNLRSLFNFGKSEHWFVDGNIAHQTTDTTLYYNIGNMGYLSMGYGPKTVWGVDPDTMFFAGTKGFFLSFRGGHPFPPQDWSYIHDFSRIAGTSNSNFWLEGTDFHVNLAEGIVLHYDGSQFSEIINTSDPNWNQEWGYPRDIYCDNEQYAILLTSRALLRVPWDPSSEIEIMAGFPTHFSPGRFAGTSENDLFLCGYGSELWHYNGDSLFRYDIPDYGDFNRIAVSEHTIAAAGVQFRLDRGSCFALIGSR